MKNTVMILVVLLITACSNPEQAAKQKLEDQQKALLQHTPKPIPKVGTAPATKWNEEFKKEKDN